MYVYIITETYCVVCVCVFQFGREGVCKLLTIRLEVVSCELFWKLGFGCFSGSVIESKGGVLD